MKKVILPLVTNEEWNNCNDYISKSRLNLFEFCEIKYRKQYIDHVLPKEDTHATTIGTRYHNFMETFMEVAPKHGTDRWHEFIHPDFTEEEKPMLQWSITREINQHNTYGELPVLATEYRVIDHTNKLRGIIDYIGVLDDETISVVEYKTSKKIYKPKLQLEFGFYDVLLDSIKELEGYKRTYTVINPRLQQAVSFSPSRHTTIMRKLQNLHEAIAKNNFKPLCKGDYATTFCDKCSLEEIETYNNIYIH